MTENWWLNTKLSYGCVLYIACAFWSLLAYLKNKNLQVDPHHQTKNKQTHKSVPTGGSGVCHTDPHHIQIKEQTDIRDSPNRSGPQGPRGLWWTSVPLEVSQKVHKCIPVPILKEPQRQYRSCDYQTQTTPANHRQNLRAGWKQG